MNSDKILQYLLDHPDFLINNEEVLLANNLVLNNDSNIKYIIEYQAELLKKDNQKLQQELAEIVAVADFNYNEQLKIQKFVLSIIKQKSLTQLLDFLIKNIPKKFNLLTAVIIIWRKSDIKQANKDKILRYLDDNQPYCGIINDEDNDLLFNNKSASVAIMPIGSTNYGILALSAKDKRFFDDNISTNLLSFLADVIYLSIIKVSPKLAD